MAKDVADNRGCTETGRFLTEQLRAPGEHDDVRTLFSQRFGAGESEAGRRAEDKCRAPLEPEVHGCSIRKTPSATINATRPTSAPWLISISCPNSIAP